MDCIIYHGEPAGDEAHAGCRQYLTFLSILTAYILFNVFTEDFQTTLLDACFSGTFVFSHLLKLCNIEVIIVVKLSGKAEEIETQTGQKRRKKLRDPDHWLF